MSASPHATSPLLAAARQWHDAGYCVVPSHEDQSKRPMGQWKDYTVTRPAWRDVEGWLATGRYTGIGVICGQVSGNVELVELEGPADAAVDRLAQLIAQAERYDAAAGDTYCRDLVATVARGCVEQSAGGGLHMLYRVTDAPAKPNTKLAMQGPAGPNRHVVAETRGEGGFVIVAPTTARKGHADGTAYLFLQGSSPDRTPTITGEQRDVLHLLVTLALDQPLDTPLPTPAPATPTGPVDAATPFGDYRTRTTWADILTPQGWQQGATRSDGRTEWTRPGKDRREGISATSIEDGPLYLFTTSTDLPAERGLSKEWVYAHYHHGGDLSTAAKALRAAGYGTDTVTAPTLPPWLPDATGDGIGLSDAERADVRGEWVRTHLPALDWHALWQDETEEEWIVEPLLAARRLVALYSAPKVGKSLLMLEIAAAIACGRGMFGYPPTGGPRRTLYVDYENDPRGDTRARLVDMGYAPDDLANLVMLSFPTLAALDTDAGADQLMAAVAEYRCEIVVIDTVSRSVEGDENENDTWLKFYRATGLRLKQAGVALIRLDHSGKDATKGQRGGSAKSGDVDAIWQLRKVDDDVLELECDAARFPVPEKKVTLRRLEGPLRHDVDGQAWQQVRDKMVEKLYEAKVPKDPKPTVAQATEYLRAAGVSFTKGLLNRPAIDRYVASVPSMQAITMPSDGDR